MPKIARPEESTDSEIEKSLLALIKTKLGERNPEIGRPSAEAFLAGRGPLLVEDLGIFARLFDTTLAALLAEAVGNRTLTVQVKLVEQLVPALKQWQAQVRQWRSEIPPSPQEDAMLEGDEEQDEATQMRALLDCIHRQHLAGTIAAAQEMVTWPSKGKP